MLSLKSKSFLYRHGIPIPIPCQCIISMWVPFLHRFTASFLLIRTLDQKVNKHPEPAGTRVTNYKDFMILSYVCLDFFRPIRAFFTHSETSPLPVKGTYGHWATEGSLACHTYCNTGHPFIMVIFEVPWHSHLLPSIWQWSCHYLF